MGLILAVMVAQFVAAQGSPYALAPESRLWIEGDSNLHPWSCEAKKVSATIFSDPGSPLLARGLFLYVPISAIDCGNGTMNDKLRDALHRDAHPAILFKLSAVDRTTADGLRVQGELTINGVKRAITFPATGVLEQGGVHARGAVPLLMSDYGVDPPGMLFLHTKNEITVKFDIRAAQKRLAARASQP